MHRLLPFPFILHLHRSQSLLQQRHPRLQLIRQLHRYCRLRFILRTCPLIHRYRHSKALQKNQEALHLQKILCHLQLHLFSTFRPSPSLLPYLQISHPIYRSPYLLPNLRSNLCLHLCNQLPPYMYTHLYHPPNPHMVHPYHQILHRLDLLYLLYLKCRYYHLL